MKRVHIVGRKNSGKTTLVADLVAEYVRRGVCVGTIKHTHHQHELDTPGKDSHKHREAGAATVGILSRTMNAVFWPPREAEQESKESRYEEFAAFYAECDLVLVEGDTQAKAPKVEVWRAELGTAPIAQSDDSILAMITDDETDLKTPNWPRTNITLLADQIMALSNS